MPLLPFYLLVFALTPALALAGPLSITTNSTTAQTVGAGSSKTGTVAAGASLKVTGDAAALTMSGNGATFSNFGTLAHDGGGNAILAERGAGLVINNGSRTNSAALIQATDSETIKAKKSVSGVTLNNYGTVASRNVSNNGGQAVDFGKVGGANTINNHAGGEVRATDADAVRPGPQGVVVNAGKIVTIKKSNDKGFGAIDAQFNTGIRVTNVRGGLIDGARHGITGGSKKEQGAFTMHVTNEPGAIIRGHDGAGMNFDGQGAGQVVTVVNDGTIEGTGVTGDGDGVDIDGMVDLVNTGTVRSANASGKPGETPYSEAVSVGGGTIVNAGTIEGLATGAGVVGRGIALVGIDIDGTRDREGIYGNSRIENRPGGIIRGSNESAIVAKGQSNDFTITIDNQAGATIVGGGTAEAAIHSTSNSTSITNAGTIDGAASGKAIAFEHAGNTLTVKGGNAVIKGAIDGGAGGGNTMVVDAGAGQQFAYAGAIARFDTLSVKSGNARLSGQLGFKNKTVVSGGSLTLVGPQPIAPGSALVLAGGVLNVAETGTAGQAFASLSLEGNAAIETGRAVLSFERVGKVVPGKTLKLSGPLRIVGNQGRDAAFLALVRATRIKDEPATASFDGRYTNLVPASARTRLARIDKR